MRVLEVDQAKRRIKLTLASKKMPEAEEQETAGAAAAAAAGGEPWGGLVPGALVDGVVAQVQEGGEGKAGSYSVAVTLPSGHKLAGRLEEAHMADHPAAVAALKKVGALCGWRCSGL